MSSGDPYDFDDDPPARSIRDWREIIRAYPKVLQLQKKYMELRNVHSYDIPYLAGISTKRDRIFFDRHLEYIQTIGGKRLNVNPCIKLHEATEAALLDCWDLFYAKLRFPKTPNYEIAHHIATAVEYEAVEGLDVKVSDYRKCLRPQMKEAVSEKIEKVPRDYDTFPIESEPHAKSDEQILRAVHAAMEKDKGSSRLGFRKKRDKRSVDYSKGHPPGGDYCGACRFYQGGEHTDGPCEKVEGTVAWDYWCELFTREAGA